MTTNHDIVPIGKYKGQPLERLMADQPYSEWLLAQAWFVDRYAELAQLLRMGRLQEPQDTPEHNAMVAGLIDQRDAMEALISPFYSKWSDDIEGLYLSAMSQEIEPKGADIKVSFNMVWLMIEAKPIIGDDYPTVIRQVKAGMGALADRSRCRAIVIANRVEPTNLSVEQVRRQFELAGVRLVLEQEFFAAGEIWAEQRAEYLNTTIPALEAQISEARFELAARESQPEAKDGWGIDWDRKREIERLTSAIEYAERRLVRLKDLAADTGARQ